MSSVIITVSTEGAYCDDCRFQSALDGYDKCGLYNCRLAVCGERTVRAVMCLDGEYEYMTLKSFEPSEENLVETAMDDDIPF